MVIIEITGHTIYKSAVCWCRSAAGSDVVSASVDHKSVSLTNHQRSSQYKIEENDFLSYLDIVNVESVSG